MINDAINAQVETYDRLIRRRGLATILQVVAQNEGVGTAGIQFALELWSIR